MNSIINILFSICLIIVQVNCDENAIDYGEEANTDAVKLRVYSLVQPIGQLMDAAIKRYGNVGLPVPIGLYGDAKVFAIETIPWVFSQVKSIGNSTDRSRVTAQFLGEVHGFNYMSKRLDKIRKSADVVVKGSADELLNRLKGTEQFMLDSLDTEMSIASHPLWVAFHQRIKNFLTAEFPKLYSAIARLPTEDSKQKNIAVLLADLSHVTIPPL
ncbi:unnamed protein product [Medioppia subpectinata]|uniref:Uncharacterized protein n=1 Tax=Medioppia subpectinata TaxID=1979941 RepID=A0A7R9L395_9ACAR|nr:unnamed protein product [Medioppia subpectinata]CAG2114614.1 unnamed protein product [Medioppia subpectinata]